MIADATGAAVPVRGWRWRPRAPKIFPRLHAMWPLLKQTFWKWNQDKAMKLSAALSLYAALSLAPILVISLKALTAIFDEKVAQNQVAHQMSGLIGYAGAAAINDMLKEAAKPNSGIVATIVSVVILLFTASGVFAELQDSLNTVWNVKAREDVSWSEMIKNRFLSIAMVFVIFFLLLISMFVSTVLTALTRRWADETTLLAFVTDFFLSVLVVTVLITMLFRFLPDVRIDWRDVFLGALVTAVLFKLGQYLLALYFKYGSSTSAYGAAGSFVAVLLWVYYSGWILFFGAEFTSVYAKSRGRGFQPTQIAEPMAPIDRATQGLRPDAVPEPIKS
jgi:membrane protein